MFFGLPHGFDEVVLETWKGKDKLATDRLVYNTRFQKALFVDRDMGLETWQVASLDWPEASYPRPDSWQAKTRYLLERVRRALHRRHAIRVPPARGRRPASHGRSNDVIVMRRAPRAIADQLQPKPMQGELNSHRLPNGQKRRAPLEQGT